MGVVNYRCVDSEILGDDASGDYLLDSLGSVTGLTNALTGLVTNSFRYSPCGTKIFEQSASPKPVFLWLGSAGYRTTQTPRVNYYVRRRHYGSGSGTWTTTDLLWPKEPPYAYGDGNPVNAVDYFGLACKPKDECCCCGQTVRLSDKVDTYPGTTMTPPFVDGKGNPVPPIKDFMGYTFYVEVYWTAERIGKIVPMKLCKLKWEEKASNYIDPKTKYPPRTSYAPAPVPNLQNTMWKDCHTTKCERNNCRIWDGPGTAPISEVIKAMKAHPGKDFYDDLCIRLTLTSGCDKTNYPDCHPDLVTVISFTVTITNVGAKTSKSNIKLGKPVVHQSDAQCTARKNPMEGLYKV